MTTAKSEFRRRKDPVRDGFDGAGVILLLEAIIKRCPNRAGEKGCPKNLTHKELQQFRNTGMVDCGDCILGDLDPYWWGLCRKDAHERQDAS